MAEPFLHLKGITKSFPGVQALNNVDLEAYAGEALGLVGANGAGKSTLMNVLGGVVKEDGGEIFIGGTRVDIHNPLDAATNGIAFVHQEMALLPTMSIADNLYLTTFPTHNGLIDYKITEEYCERALSRLGYSFSPRTRIRDLSAGDRQIVEITRALLSDPSVIIFDEPTSSLTSREKKRLFEVIDSLKKDGVTIIYITHFLDEIFTVCDRSVVLRNGETAGHGLIKDLTYDDIVEMMIGTRRTSDFTRRAVAATAEVALEVEGIHRKGVLDDISFALHQGEIVGLWGLLGSGRTELARAIVGLDPIDGGRLEINDNGIMTAARPRQTGQWIGIITEDRRQDGLILPLSVKFNISLANITQLISPIWPLIDRKKETELCQKFVDQLGIMLTGLDQPVGTLSGGNQQKVVVAKWLQKNPIIYIMDEPTRGLDVGAKAEIHNIIGELAENGAAILVIMSDIDEIMAISDRYLVMNRGRIVAEYPADVTKNELMTTATGALNEEQT
jgi:ABC-type sugar transport system ATPase subunit